MKTKFIIVFTVICAPLYSQEIELQDKNGTDSRHEISVGFTNVFKDDGLFEYLWYSEYYGEYDFIFMDPYFTEIYGISSYGVGYKYHLAKSSIRCYFDFGSNKNSSERVAHGESGSYPTRTVYNDDYKINLFSVRAGYEFCLKIKKLDILYGPEISCRSGKIEMRNRRNTEYLDEWNNVQNIYTDIDDNKNKYYDYGGGAFIGIRYYLNETISLSTETRINIYGYQAYGTYESSIGYDNDLQTSTENQKSRGIKSKISPFGILTLDIHF